MMTLAGMPRQRRTAEVSIIVIDYMIIKPLDYINTIVYTIHTYLYIK